MFLKEKKMEKGPRKYKEVARRLKRALVEKDIEEEEKKKEAAGSPPPTSL